MTEYLCSLQKSSHLHHLRIYLLQNCLCIAGILVLQHLLSKNLPQVDLKCDLQSSYESIDCTCTTLNVDSELGMYRINYVSGIG